MVAVYLVSSASHAPGANIALAPLYDTLPATGPAGLVSVNVDPLIVAGSMGSENVTVIVGMKTGTLVTVSPGDVPTTRGACVVGGGGAPPAVVKAKTWLCARALPATSRAPVPMVAVYRVPAASDAFGVSV